MTENPRKRVRTFDHWPTLFTLAERATSIFDEHVVNVQDADPFGQRVPSHLIYVRECCRALCPRIFDLLGKETKLILTGSPGIGKSLFGLLLEIEFVRLKMYGQVSKAIKGITHILYEHVRSDRRIRPFILHHRHRAQVYHFEIERKAILPHINSKQTLLVKDGACNEYDHRCPSVWISSPRPQSLRKYTEESNVRSEAVCTTNRNRRDHCVFPRGMRSTQPVRASRVWG
jgi:hypothetical protein